MVAGGRITEAVVRQALSTPDARKIVMQARPDWSEVEPRVRSFRRNVPATKRSC
jgi:hypothetical protein